MGGMCITEGLDPYPLANERDWLPEFFQINMTANPLLLDKGLKIGAEADATIITSMMNGGGVSQMQDVFEEKQYKNLKTMKTVKRQPACYIEPPGMIHEYMEDGQSSKQGMNNLRNLRQSMNNNGDQESLINQQVTIKKPILHVQTMASKTPLLDGEDSIHFDPMQTAGLPQQRESSKGYFMSNGAAQVNTGLMVFTGNAVSTHHAKGFQCSEVNQINNPSGFGMSAIAIGKKKSNLRIEEINSRSQRVQADNYIVNNPLLNNSQAKLRHTVLEDSEEWSFHQQFDLLPLPMSNSKMNLPTVPRLMCGGQSAQSPHNPNGEFNHLHVKEMQVQTLGTEQPNQNSQFGDPNKRGKRLMDNNLSDVANIDTPVMSSRGKSQLKFQSINIDFSDSKSIMEEEVKEIPSKRSSSRTLMSTRTINRSPQLFIKQNSPLGPFDINILDHAHDDHLGESYVSREEAKKESKYDKRSLYIFHIDFCLRRHIISIVESRYFEWMIMLIIFLNSLTLALYDYSDRDSNTQYNQVIDHANLVFTSIFITEAALKMVAQGLILHPNAYLRSGWNIIDATVVSSGILEISVGSVKLKSLRVMRILRPLKTINALAGMRRLLTTLINTIPEFANVVMFLVFIFILFATIGLHQFNGQFYNACRYNPAPESLTSWAYDDEDQRLCSTSGLGNYQCPTGLYCGNPVDFPEYDIKYENMDTRVVVNFGITNFDNIGTSLLSVFQIITSDTWYQQLCNFMDVDIPVFGAIYCFLMIIIGQFFLLNLFLAVIVFSFIKSQQDEVSEEIQILREERQKIEQERKLEELQNSKAEDEKNVGKNQQQDGDFAVFLRPQAKKRKVANMFMQAKTRRIDENGQEIENTGLSPRTTKAATGKEFKKINEDDDFSRVGLVQEDDVTPQHLVQQRQNIVIAIDQQEIVNKSQVALSTNNLKTSNINGSSQQQITKTVNKEINSARVRGGGEHDSAQVLNQSVDNYYLNSHHKDDIDSVSSRKSKEDKNQQQDQGVRGQSVKNGSGTNVAGLNPPTGASVINITHPAAAGAGQSAVQGESGFLLGENELLHRKRTIIRNILLNQSNSINSAQSKRNSFVNDINGERSPQVKLGEGEQPKNDYDQYLNNLLKEATENVNPGQNANMRELVGIKVGLEYIKQQADDQEKAEREYKLIEKRRAMNKVFRYAIEVTESNYFSSFVAMSISVNTLILSLDSYPEDFEITNVVEKMNLMFAFIFAFDLIIKILAYGVIGFLRGSFFNVFDCIIVIASTIDIVMSNILLSEDNSASGSIFTALRGFRLLRIFKLAKQWKRFELLLETMGKSLKDILNFAVFLFLFIFIFTLMALELFAYKAKVNPITQAIDMENGVTPTYNFDNFLNSFSLVFIILTNDGTSAIYYNYYRAVGAAASSVFFVLLVLIGQKVIINLFVAILLENFDESAVKQKLHDYQEEANGESTSVRLRRHFDVLKKSFADGLQQCFFKVFPCLSKENEEDEDGDEPKLEFQSTLNKSGSIANLSFKHSSSKIDIDSRGPPQGKSLYLFGSRNKARKFAHLLVGNIWFEYTIILTIIVSSVTLALDSPQVDPKSHFSKSLYWIDNVTTLIFVFEAMMKILAYGFWFNGEQSYFSNLENKFDFTIIVFSILSMTPLSDDFKSLKVLRTIRVINRNHGLKIAVKALAQALPNVANVTLIMILFFLIFGVILVSQFKGKFFYCEESIDVLGLIINSKWDCLNSGGIWQNQIYTFDNVPNALVTLFVMSTTAGWQDVLLNSITSTDIDYVAGEYRDPFWTVFYIFFLILGFFFFLNLFIGVVVSTFNTEQDKLGGNDLLTEQQREWIDLKLLVLRCGPIKKIKPPENPFLQIFYNIQAHPNFENIIFVSIVLNTLVLTMKWYEQNHRFENALEFINYIFTAIFLGEAIIKILGQKPRIYFDDGWNRFDFIIALGSMFSIVMSQYSSLQLKGALTLIRSIRLLRILRLLRRSGRSLYMIFNTFVITLQSLANIGGLLMLIIYMYSVLGMFLLGQMKREDLMNDYINFENFLNSFITLFILATGDSWDGLQQAMAHTRTPNHDCIRNPTFQDYIDHGEMVGCGSKIASYCFFLSYIFIVTLIFLQLFIAVILQGYDDTQIQEARLFNNDMTQKFRDIWADFDPNATTFIQLHQLREFLEALGEPLGFDPHCNGRRFFQDQFIAQLELPTYHNFTQYQFLDVLDALSFRLMVLDHIKKKYDDGGEKQDELDIKTELTQEINKLIYQRKLEGVSSVKDVMNKESKKGQKKQAGQDTEGLTSSHHMAAEATVRKMREFIKKKGQSSLKGLTVGSIQGIKSLESQGSKHLLPIDTTNIRKMSQLMEEEKKLEIIYQELHSIDLDSRKYEEEPRSKVMMMPHESPTSLAASPSLQLNNSNKYIKSSFAEKAAEHKRAQKKLSSTKHTQP